MHKFQGFTLVELMIVVVIIGLISAMAIPQYQDYIAKSQLNRVVGELSSYRSATDDNLMRGAADFTPSDLGYVNSTLLTPNLTPSNAGFPDYSIRISDQSSTAGIVPATAPFVAGGGALLVELNSDVGEASPAVNSVIVIMVRSTRGIWNCEIDATSAITSGTWKASFMPSSCSQI